MTRGINLGCGTNIMPTARPDHHRLIPETLYTDADIQWDNVDWNAGPGVNKVVDLFDYPWFDREAPIPAMGNWKDQVLPDNTYDFALASHIVEHIPHHIVWEGQFMHRHPEYQDGWFAWFAQLWRVMKHGGKAYVLCPFVWSDSAFMDPTHTRHVGPGTFNYFSNIDQVDPPFRYRMAQRWSLDLTNIHWTPHNYAWAKFRRSLKALDALTDLVTGGTLDFPGGDWIDDETMKPPDALREDVASFGIWNIGHNHINAIVDFMVEMTAVKE